MVGVMLILCMGCDGEIYCQFMYTKRMFQWQMDSYSYFTMIQTLVNDIGSLLMMPVFHHFNINDNLIVLASCVSCIAQRLTKAFAKTEVVFFASNGLGGLMYAFYAPLRAQISRCVPSEELGKVNAVLASLQAVWVFISSNSFTAIYNATSDLQYPWQATFYFASVACVVTGRSYYEHEIIFFYFPLLGSVITITVYISLGCRQIKSSEEEEEEKSSEGQSSNLNPDDKTSRPSEIMCVAYRRYGNFD